MKATSMANIGGERQELVTRRMRGPGGVSCLEKKGYGRQSCDRGQQGRSDETPPLASQIEGKLSLQL
jgi:hypothetical protein